METRGEVSPAIAEKEWLDGDRNPSETSRVYLGNRAQRWRRRTPLRWHSHVRHNILVVGSFIGLDIDGPGIGQQISEVASRLGLDNSRRGWVNTP